MIHGCYNYSSNQSRYNSYERIGLQNNVYFLTFSFKICIDQWSTIARLQNVNILASRIYHPNLNNRGGTRNRTNQMGVYKKIVTMCIKTKCWNENWLPTTFNSKVNPVHYFLRNLNKTPYTTTLWMIFDSCQSEINLDFSHYRFEANRGSM